MEESGKQVEDAAEAEIVRLRSLVDRLYPDIEAVFVKARAEEAYHDESPIVAKIRSAISAGFEIRGAFDQAASQAILGYLFRRRAHYERKTLLAMVERLRLEVDADYFNRIVDSLNRYLDDERIERKS
ncbi:hypothetical protein [Thioalkalivibrio sp. HK1]|uniref:hypothetical protein n=1 Tax=Thioalkalivibrio sp. HK1 TaxID=1469245 RepID=UPI0012DFD453|nr:hypothetical protein [Thioalkalivibrio sp. HK1]